MASDLTVILTTYRRPAALARQLAAVRNQLVNGVLEPPKQIIIYQNDPESAALVPEWEKTMAELQAAGALEGSINVNSNKNWGVWQRFMLALDCETEFVQILDDDTFPGPRWVENCQGVMSREEALLGTHGQIFPKIGRHINRGIGWPNQNAEPTVVDIVGSSWYFKRDWIRHFAAEPRCGYARWGEYYHFSIALWNQARIRTIVPAHPANDRDWWGSTDPYVFGEDNVATFKHHSKQQIDRVHNCYLERGWQPIAARG